MSRTLFVSVAAVSILLGACVREGNGVVPMSGGVDAASVHHSDAVPAAPSPAVASRSGGGSSTDASHILLRNGQPQH
jgi:hypothetical protein